MLHGFLSVLRQPSLRVLLARPSQRPSQPCQGLPLTRRARCYAQRANSERLLLVGTPRDGGRERGLWAAVFVSVIAIKQPAERQARKASLRGGHFNIVQIMRGAAIGAKLKCPLCAR